MPVSQIHEMVLSAPWSKREIGLCQVRHFLCFQTPFPLIFCTIRVYPSSILYPAQDDRSTSPRSRPDVLILKQSFLNSATSRSRSDWTVGLSGLRRSCCIQRLSVEKPIPKSAATCLRDQPLVNATRTASARYSGVGFGAMMFLPCGKIPSQRNGTIPRQVQDKLTALSARSCWRTAMNGPSHDTTA